MHKDVYILINLKNVGSSDVHAKFGPLNDVL